MKHNPLEVLGQMIQAAPVETWAIPTKRFKLDEMVKLNKLDRAAFVGACAIANVRERRGLITPAEWTEKGDRAIQEYYRILNPPPPIKETRANRVARPAKLSKKERKANKKQRQTEAKQLAAEGLAALRKQRREDAAVEAASAAAEEVNAVVFPSKTKCTLDAVGKQVARANRMLDARVEWNTRLQEWSVALTESQKRTKAGKLVWSPSEELIELCKEKGMVMNRYDRLVVPAFGGDSAEEVLPGLPLWMFTDKSGEVTTSLNPIGALETDDHETLAQVLCAEVAKAAAEGGTVPFIAAKKMWAGPAHILDTFGPDGARIYAAMGSTNVRGVYTTPDLDVKVYVVNLSDPESVLALVAAHPEAVEDAEKLIEWMGTNPPDHRVEVDGMALCGRRALPGNSEACQLRAIAMHEVGTIQKYENANQAFSEFILARVKEGSTEQAVVATYNEAVRDAITKLDMSSIKVRYAKGMLAKSHWLNSKTVLLDVNTLKGRDKAKIKEIVEEVGFWRTNDLAVGMLQDIGTGNMSMSWQAIMHFLWKLPDSFPAIWDNDGEAINMSGRYGLEPAQARAMATVDRALDEFSKGLVDNTMSKILQYVLQDDIKQVDGVTDDLTMALWNNVVVRNEVATWVMNFLRRNQYLFQTQGMEKIDQILPQKRYMLDMNWLPNEKETVPVRLHDGTYHNAPLVFLQDKKFWARMGVDEIPMVMFRHPVADKRVVDVVLARNPNAFGWSGLAKGMWLNSRITKEKFTGDTDGDLCGYFPLWCPKTDGQHIDYTMEDYAFFYTVVKSSVQFGEAPPNVEDYLARVTPTPILPFLGEAEKVMAASGKLVGSAALLQSQVLRLFGHYLSGDLVVTNNEYQDKLDDFANTILRPLYIELPAILELSISLQKKNVMSVLCEALNNATFNAGTSRNEVMFRELIKAVVHGTNSDHEYVEMLTSQAMQLGRVVEFKDNWGNAVCSLMRIIMADLGIVVKNDDGTMSPVEYAYADRHTRFADQMKTQDPEMCFGTFDNLNWGILQPSNLKDALAGWSRVYNEHAILLKEKTIRLTENKSVGDNRLLMTSANRCVGTQAWQYITPGNEVSPEEHQLLADMYARKIMWSNLGLKVSWNRRLTANPRNSAGDVKAFELGSATENPATSFIAWIIASDLADSKMTSIHWNNAVRWLLKECESKEFGIVQAKQRAAQWIERVKLRLSESDEETSAEWTLFNMSRDFQAEFFKVLEDAATLLLHESSQGLKLNPFEVKEHYVLQTANNLHDESVRVALLLCLGEQCWIPSENDFRKILECVKSIRGNMNLEKTPWREATNEIKDGLPADTLIECWRIAYNKEELEEILSLSTICEQERARALKSPVQYYFAAWGFDAMREWGLTKSATIGDKTEDNPRIPILINKEKWDFTADWNDLTPTALYAEAYGFQVVINDTVETVNRRMHATGLKNSDGELVAILCECLAPMRIVLGFNQVRVSNDGLTKKAAAKGATFAPISKWWSDQFDGEWVRYNGSLRARNVEKD